MTVVRWAAGVLAVGLAILAGIFFTLQPNLTYDDFEIECNSIIGAGSPPGSVRDSSGGPVGFSVESGEQAVDELEKKAGEAGFKDPFYITANLERDCTDHRVSLAVWAAFSAAATAFFGAIAVTGNRRSRRA